MKNFVIRLIIATFVAFTTFQMVGQSHTPNLSSPKTPSLAEYGVFMVEEGSGIESIGIFPGDSLQSAYAMIAYKVVKKGIPRRVDYVELSRTKAETWKGKSFLASPMAGIVTINGQFIKLKPAEIQQFHVHPTEGQCILVINSIAYFGSRWEYSVATRTGNQVIAISPIDGKICKWDITVDLSSAGK